MGRVMIHVQHLLGIGHLKRAARVARACAEEGLEVVLVSGGQPVPDLDVGGARLVQLAPARAADERFRALVDGEGRAVDEAWRTARRRRLLAILHETAPHVLVIESFPFGRRLLRFELLPLLEAAARRRPRPRVLASIRDILVEKRKPERNEETAALVETHFDAVLVHGDPRLVTLDRTFALAPRIEDRIVYTGYVAGPAHEGAGEAGRDEVIVSAGGGAVGERLLECAIAARAETRLATRTWRILGGANASDASLERLRRGAPASVVVERARRDFAALLANATLSISQAGYNTVAELLGTRTRCVLVPFAAGNESEQRLRAGLLAERGVAVVVDETELGPARLARAIEAAMARPRGESGIDLDGARTSARRIAGWARRVAA